MNVFYSLMGKIIPERLVRLLFVTSLFSQLFSSENKMDFSVYQKLNSVMNVAQNEQSLDLGALLSSSFWNGCPLEHVQTELKSTGELTLSLESKQALAREIINVTPKWLRYDIIRMQNDVIKIIECRRFVFA